MSTAKTPARPSQTTLAGGLIIVGSVFVVLGAFQTVASIGSLDTRESVEAFVNEPPGDGLGLGVESVLQILRVLAMVTGAAAAAAAILGYHALQRSRGARLALSILALPLFVGGVATGGFVSSLVAVSALMLWLQPSRDWFNGVTPERRPEPPKVAPPLTPPPPATEARPYAGYGASPEQTPEQTPGHTPEQTPGQAPWGYTEPGPASGPVSGRVSDRRPGALVVACVLTWIFSGVTLLMTAASVALMAIDPDLVLDEVNNQQPDLADQGVTDQMLVNTTYFMGGVMVIWCLIAALLAVFAFRRQGWARIALIVSTSAVVVLSLAASLGSLVLAVPLLAAVGVLGCLMRTEVRAWFAAAPPGSTTPPPRQQPWG